MAVCIRLSRIGRLHRPYYRVVAIDRRNAREGLSNEVLGTYDPTLADGKAFQVKVEAIEAWLAKGAVLSEALRSLFKHHSVVVKLPVSTRLAKKAKDKGGPKKDGKKFVPATRRAKRGHLAALKEIRRIKTAVEVDAVKAAKAAAAAPAAEAPKA